MNSLKKQIVHIRASLMEHKAAEDGRRRRHHMGTAAAARHTEQRQAVEGPGPAPRQVATPPTLTARPAMCCRSQCKPIDATNAHCIV